MILKTSLLSAVLMISISVPIQSRGGENAAGEALAKGGAPQNLADIVERVLPGVVSIYCEKITAKPEGRDPNPPWEDDPYSYYYGPRKPGYKGPELMVEAGSGVLIGKGGYILTNHHVVVGAKRITVRLSDDREFTASIVGTDKHTDLAVIKLKEDAAGVPALKLGDSDKLRVGDAVAAVGNPFGLSHTVTTGIVSAKGRRNTGITLYEDFIQTDAAINPGNSGGALITMDGRLVGINTAILSLHGGYQGIGFAIPINAAKKIMEELVSGGEVTRGWLGVSVEIPSPGSFGSSHRPGRKGSVVSEVFSGSPADKAGVKKGDLIVRIDEAEIQNPESLLHYVAKLRPGSSAHLRIKRENRTLSLKVRIGLRKDQEPGKD